VIGDKNTMKTPTIYDIKYLITNDSHYFDRSTMRFFGQTLKDFHVRKSPSGRIFIYAPTKHNNYSIREFADNKLINVSSKLRDYLQRTFACDFVRYESMIISFINES